MIKAVIFDLFETLITEWVSDKYTSRKCAEDLGVDYALFREVWESLHRRMYTGLCTYEQALGIICDKAGVALTSDKLAYCTGRRTETKAQCFRYPHDDIMHMLDSLKSKGARLALCSNCYSEEAAELHSTRLYRLFDAVILSYEAGCAKPDASIYGLCTEKLSVSPGECLYIGDGGSRELYGAEAAGMKPFRAMWFIDQYKKQAEPMPFMQIHQPREVIELYTNH